MTMFEDLIRLRNELERAAGARPGGPYPPANVYDDGDAFHVRAEIPGIDKTALEVTVKANQLLIRGQRIVAPASEQAAYHRREREGGTFRRIVTLPERVDAERIQASYTNGVLEVTVPRAAESRPRKIAIA